MIRVFSPKFFCLFCGLLIALFAFSGNAFSKEMRQTIPRLAAHAKSIVVAKCTAVQSRRDPENGPIFTFSTFEVLKRLKGKEEDKQFQLKLIGGTVGDVTGFSADMPQFSPGETVLLFLGPKNSSGYPVLTTLLQSVIRFTKAQDGTLVTVTPLEGLTMFQKKDGALIIDGRTEYSLDDVVFSLSKVLTLVK